MASQALVVGVDFSPASRRAARAAAAWAVRGGFPLVLVHAFPPSARRLAGAPRRTVKQAVAEAEVDEATRLSRWAEGLRADGVEVDVVARAGKPAEVLLSEAKRRRAALVALGTTGKGALRRLFLGSTARRVAAQAAIPVLLFPQRGRVPRTGPVVAGIDLAGGAGRVATAAAALASDLGEALHLVHTVPVPVTGTAPDVGPIYTPEMLADQERDAALSLTELAEPMREELHVRTFVEVGDAATALLTHARRGRAACIVVGRRRTPRLGFGSVSAALVQRSDRPLLVVPRRQAGR